MEEEIMKRERVPFFGIKTGKFRRYFNFQNFVDFFRVPIGIFQSILILKKLKPDVIFAKGGYVSLPAGLAASFLRIPLVLHESDATPGLATRFLKRFATKVFYGFGEGGIGTPIREEILQGKKEEGYQRTGFSAKEPVVMILGGSLGALSLNNLVWESLLELQKFCQIIHLTGKGKGNPAAQKSHRYVPIEYADESLPHFYACSNVIITRAGASVLSEIIALRKQNILIPLGTHASRGDQWANAKFFQEKFHSTVLSENNLTTDQFIAAVKETLQKKNVAIPESLSHLFQESARTLAAYLLSLSQGAPRS